MAKAACTHGRLILEIRDLIRAVRARLLSRQSHPYRGVYLADVGAQPDVWGNPSGLRDAPIGAYQQVGRVALGAFAAKAVQ